MNEIAKNNQSLEASRQAQEITKKLSELLSIAVKEAGHISNVNIKKSQVLEKFIETCEEKGLGHLDLMQEIKDAINIFKEQKKSREHLNALKLWKELTMSPSFEMGRILNQVAIPLTQNNQQNNFFAEDKEQLELQDIKEELVSRRENEQTE